MEAVAITTLTPSEVWGTSAVEATVEMGAAAGAMEVATEVVADMVAVGMEAEAMVVEMVAAVVVAAVTKRSSNLYFLSEAKESPIKTGCWLILVPIHNNRYTNHQLIKFIVQ